MVAAYDSGTPRYHHLFSEFRIRIIGKQFLRGILYDCFFRAHQMLTILDAILPQYLRQLVNDKTADVKELREKIQGLSHVLKTVIHNSDKLTQ